VKNHRKQVLHRRSPGAVSETASFLLFASWIGLATAALCTAGEDAGPTVPDRAALDREMIELNGQVERRAQTIPASGQLDVLSNDWDRAAVRIGRPIDDWE
jgi:hypothetical protein